MTNEKYLTQAEALDVQTAMLSTHEKFLARITISSLRLLQQIAQEEQVKVEDLTPKQIPNGLNEMPSWKRRKVKQPDLYSGSRIGDENSQPSSRISSRYPLSTIVWVRTAC